MQSSPGSLFLPESNCRHSSDHMDQHPRGSKRKHGDDESRQIQSAIVMKSDHDQTSRSDLDVDVDVGLLKHVLNDIPEGMLLEILERLPVESLFRFKCVCKRWFSLISHPSFARSYVARRASFRILFRFIIASEFQEIFDKLRRPTEFYNSHNSPVLLLFNSMGDEFRLAFFVVAVSNGLVLCRGVNKDRTCVCDPVTRQWVELPQPGPPCLFDGTKIFIEGFVTQSNAENVVISYKVVRVWWRHYSHSQSVYFEIFSSESGLWSQRELACSEPISLLWSSDPVISFNGILHWFVENHKLLAFDPYKDDDHNDTDLYRLIPLPDKGDNDADTKSNYRPILDERQEHLRYFKVKEDEHNSCCFRMWVLKDYEKEEWCLELQVKHSDIWSDDIRLMTSNHLLSTGAFIPLCFHPLNKNVVFLKCSELPHVVSYNIQTNSLDIVDRSDLYHFYYLLDCHSVVPYVLPVWPTPVPSSSTTVVTRY